MEGEINIPRKPKAPTPPPPSTPEPVSTTGKRKRNADEAELTNGDASAKRLHADGGEVNGNGTGDDGTQPIVLDEADGGAILIDDD